MYNKWICMGNGLYVYCFLFQGPGLLVSDDDTALHGEFSDDWIVNGKVDCLYM